MSDRSNKCLPERNFCQLIQCEPKRRQAQEQPQNCSRVKHFLSSEKFKTEFTQASQELLVNHIETRTFFKRTNKQTKG